MTIASALFSLAAALAWAGASHHHELDKSAPGYQQFDKLRSVLGEWEGKGPEGAPVRIWYRLISGGSVLLETEKLGEEPEMITVYHLDKDALVMTHYCSANNQPFMRAAPPKGEVKQIEFSLERVGNLADPQATHMRALLLRFPAADRLVQRWTWREKGQDQTVEFDLARVKKDKPRS